MQFVDPFIWGRDKINIDIKFPTNPRIPTMLNKTPGTINSKKSLTSSSSSLFASFPKMLLLMLESVRLSIIFVNSTMKRFEVPSQIWYYNSSSSKRCNQLVLLFQTFPCCVLSFWVSENTVASEWKAQITSFSSSSWSEFSLVKGLLETVWRSVKLKMKHFDKMVFLRFLLENMLVVSTFFSVFLSELGIEYHDGKKGF